MNARTDIVIPAIGQPFGGGILLARYFLGEQARALVGARRQDFEHVTMPWSSSNKHVDGALSLFDGLANTEAMLAAGSDTAKKVRALRIGELDDWHIAARGQALLAFDAQQHLSKEERFEQDWYWTSTQSAFAERWAWYQTFRYGYQITTHKASQLRLFAVRSLPI